jgi:hypothetical protein
VSHWHHEAGPHAAVVVQAKRIGDTRVWAAALAWLARDHALRGRFWARGVRKGSSVHPGARGWGGWQAGKVPSAEQHSAMADEFYRYVEHGQPFKGRYSAGLDVETVQVLQAAPREAIRASARLVDLSTVVLAAPVYEIREKGTVTRWWDPPRAVTNTRPTVYVATVTGGRDSYHCTKGAEWEALMARAGEAVTVGRAA